MVYDVLLCGAGFVLLWFSAEWLVKGASSLATSLGVAPVTVGLTVVAFGTSAPELVVSSLSALDDKPMIAIGNAIGSNVCNLALVLGLCAVLRPITASAAVVRRDFPLMLAVTVLLLALLVDDRLSRLDGAILFGGILAYMFLQISLARRAGRRADQVAEEVDRIGLVDSRGIQLLLLGVGIAGVVGGADLVVDAAERIMRDLGVDEKFVGLTIVAFGTSLPELATSAVAAVRGQMDLSLGNLVGSNVFNILSVLGAAALIRPFAIPGGVIGSGLAIDLGVVLFTSALPLLLLARSRRIGRGGGLLLLAVYAGYLGWLVASRTGL